MPHAGRDLKIQIVERARTVSDNRKNRAHYSLLIVGAPTAPNLAMFRGRAVMRSDVLNSSGIGAAGE
jgi:hypothetical protein